MSKGSRGPSTRVAVVCARPLQGRPWPTGQKSEPCGGSAPPSGCRIVSSSFAGLLIRVLTGTASSHRGQCFVVVELAPPAPEPG
jgi:hypothetical protein